MEKEEYHVIGTDVYEDDWLDEDNDLTYEDICEVVSTRRRITDIRDMVREYEYQQQENMEILDNMTNDLWDNVMVPYLETCGDILNKSRMEVRMAFAEWVYKNSNIGQRIGYIARLENALKEPEPNDLSSPVRIPGICDGVITGDERQ